ncbi:flagellar export chaperone FlgN [Panacagrimonas sp.]|uniref:flagellar export chaperone FlgN n=1 Tax=Panacagrimonas sp. TaxID=2480088 RepID=UPI003B524226
MSTADTVRRNLDAQYALAEELDALLLQERERVQARDWPAVLAISRDKVTRVQRLQKLATDLQLQAAGNALPAWLRSLDLDAELDRLALLAARLQRSNRESRSLLDHHQARVGAALKLLQRSQGPGLYGRHGQASTGRISRVLAAA